MLSNCCLGNSIFDLMEVCREKTRVPKHFSVRQLMFADLLYERSLSNFIRDVVSV